MKKVISLFLSLAMLLSIVSVVDFSAYADVQTGSCGDNVKYSLDTSTGVLTISGTGKMKDYFGRTHESNHSPFYYNSYIKSIIIENSVTSIGDDAFYGCASLTSVTIPYSVTSIGYDAFYDTAYYNDESNWNNGVLYISDCLIDTNDDFDSTTDYTIKGGTRIIADYAFLGCRSLTSVTIPDSVTSIGDQAFNGCTNLTNATIGNGVTSIGEYAFSSCTSLKSVTIPNSITSIDEYAFWGCTSLKFVTYNGTKSQCKSIEGYYNISKIIKCTDGIIGGGNTVTIDSLKYIMYYDTVSLVGYTVTPENLMIPESISYEDENENYEFKVTSIGKSAFKGCTSLTSVTIPNSVTSIGSYAFEDCTSLTSVTIPDSVTSIGYHAFYDCTSLTSIDYNGTVSQLKSIKGYGNVLKIIKCTDGIIGNGNTVTVDNLKYKIYDDTATLVGYTDSPENLVISKNISYGGYTLNVTSIGDSAFEDCTSLTSVNYSGTKSQWKAITIGSDNYYLTHAFIKCTDGIIGNGNTVTIDNLKYKIYDDTASLVGYTDTPENLVISKNISYEGYTLNVTSIGESAFSDCTSLTSVTIPDSVTSIGDSAFYNCTSLTSVTIPDSVTSIGKYAFYKCTSLTSVTIPDNVTSIGDSAFSDCTSLTSITIPDSVTSISNFAFYKCTSLTSVTVPDSVTSIGNYAFNGCTSLTSVTIPNSVTNIGESAFNGCTSLTSVTIPNSVTNIGESAFNGCTSLTSVTIPDSVTSIGHSALSGCSNLKSVNYNGTKAQWKSISGYDNVSQIIKCTDGIYANSNTIIIDSVKYRLNDDYTAEVISYSGTPENIAILESVTYEGLTFKVTSIGSSAFSNCTSLTSITIPDSVTTIGNNAFSGCSSLTSVTIPNSVESIGDNAFQNCSSLTSATIGNNVTSIGSSAFFGCSKLKKIEVPDSVTYIGSDAFDGTAFYNTVKNWKDGVLYCGNHLISAKSDVTKITVKASTVSIAAGALDNCKSLEKINVLNPKCVINCTIPKTAVIGGAEGSTAEDFAQKNNMSIDYFEECTHSDKVQVVIAATCTEQGAVQSRCADCDKLISQTFTAPLGHTMVITTPAKAPTCTTSGNTQAGYCTVCGYNEVSTVIPATGHNFGSNSANCLVCGVANPNYVAPTQPNQNETNTSNGEDVTVTSKPKSASIKKVKGAKKAILVTWKKVSGVNGYEIQVATDKKFKKNKKTVTIKKQKTTKTTVKKLKAKKKYYVRIRTYKIVNGKKVYSSWSKVKSVKTK